MDLKLRASAIAVSVLVALPSGAAAEDVTVVSSVTTPRGTTRTQTQYLSATRMRMAGEDRDTIVDIASGKVTILDNRRKEYSETSLDEMQGFLRLLDSAMSGRPILDKAMGPLAVVTVQKGANRRKVAGYDTEPYTLTMGETMRFDAWMAADLQPPAKYFEARKTLYATMGPMGRRFDRMFDELKTIKGLPLATAVDYRMRTSRRQVTTEATEVRKGPIPDAVFAAPADYKKVASPFGVGRRTAPSPGP